MHEKELTDLYEDKLPIYLGWAVNRTRDPHLAEDMVHEAFAQAWDKRDKCDGKNVGGWVFAILRNTIHDYRRHYHRESLTPEGEMRDAAEPTEGVEGTMDLVELLKEAPEIDREAFMLVAAGFSGEQLSERWGIPTITANQRVFRARRRVERNESVNL